MGGVVPRTGYWNHNVHYQPVILNAVPAGCGAALEIGCGDGLLASRLAERCAEVTAIDRDAEMIALARSRAQATAPAGGSRSSGWLLGQRKLHSFPTIRRARRQASYSPTSAGVPLVMRMSSA